ncbi:MAG: SPOR domain-containing protein [Bacteroidales bacterium]|jgi:hypothetical protein|nr:SPOR domain-containing protein [Bacteroidales bacterium]
MYIKLFRILCLVLPLVFFANHLPAQSGKGVPADFCVDSEEAQLFTRINEARIGKGLVPLLLSKSLCFVAQTHTRDLYINRPESADCNMHSWSDKGNWSSFCYPKDQTRRKSVWDKPKELTHYPGQAFELIYWTNQVAFPDEIMDTWLATQSSSSLMLNYGKYAKNSWKTMGVAIYKGYASVWFGEYTDVEDKVSICYSDSVISSKPYKKIEVKKQNVLVQEDNVYAGQERFYLIFGSFNNIQQARDGLSKIQKDGFPNVRILEADGKFRVSLDDFGSNEAAKDARRNLSQKYKAAWILKQ